MAALSSPALLVPARGVNQPAGCHGPLGSLLSSWAPQDQGTECGGSWTGGEGHGLSLSLWRSTKSALWQWVAEPGSCQVNTRTAAGHRRLPGPHALRCPLNYGKCGRLGQSRAGLASLPRAQVSRHGRGTCVGLGGQLAKEQGERRRLGDDRSPRQNGLRKAIREGMIPSTKISTSG